MHRPARPNSPNAQLCELAKAQRDAILASQAPFHPSGLPRYIADGSAKDTRTRLRPTARPNSHCRASAIASGFQQETTRDSKI